LEGSYNYMTTQLWAGDRTVLHNHFVNQTDRFELNKMELAMALTHQTIIPMRDPLLACLSAQRRTDNRGQGFDGVHCTRELTLLAEALPLLEAYSIHPLLIIPWDLAPGAAQRGEWLQVYRKQLKLKDKAATAKWADRWPYENQKEPDYAYLQAYKQRDAAWLSGKLPAMWGKLKALEPNLRPHLEAVGYKGLIWWD
jgi:hypothetical protein